jgi:hypothetical protein
MRLNVYKCYLQDANYATKNLQAIAKFSSVDVQIR